MFASWHVEEEYINASTKANDFIHELQTFLADAGIRCAPH